MGEERKRRLFKAFVWPLSRMNHNTHHIVIFHTFWCFLLPLPLSGNYMRSMTFGSKAGHDGSPSRRLLTSICVLFNNSLNRHTTPSLLRNVTQPLTEVTQAPPLMHHFTERARHGGWRERMQNQGINAKSRPTGGVKTASPHLPILLLLSLSLLVFRCASSPLAVE